MAYEVSYTHRFKKNVDRCRKRGYPMELLSKALSILIETGTLPKEYRPHKLSGNLDSQWECHLKGDWLMTWEQNDNTLTLLMLSTGTHSDLFGKTRK